MSMFCYQCEQTTKGTGCVKTGVCGKDPITAALQDLLLYQAKGISMYAHRAARLGARDRDVDVFVDRGALHDRDERQFRSGEPHGDHSPGRRGPRRGAEAL